MVERRCTLEKYGHFEYTTVVKFEPPIFYEGRDIRMLYIESKYSLKGDGKESAYVKLISQENDVLNLKKDYNIQEEESEPELIGRMIKNHGILELRVKKHSQERNSLPNESLFEGLVF